MVFFSFAYLVYLTFIQVVHGLSIPLVKAGYNLPRTISTALSTSTAMDQEPVPLTNTSHTHSTATPTPEAVNSRGRKRGPGSEEPRLTIFRIGRSIIESTTQINKSQPGMGSDEEPERPVNLITHESEQGIVATRMPTE